MKRPYTKPTIVSEKLLEVNGDIPATNWEKSRSGWDASWLYLAG